LNSVRSVWKFDFLCSQATESFYLLLIEDGAGRGRRVQAWARGTMAPGGRRLLDSVK
jgi:hypothetical protein